MGCKALILSLAEEYLPSNGRNTKKAIKMLKGREWFLQKVLRRLVPFTLAESTHQEGQGEDGIDCFIPLLL